MKREQVKKLLTNLKIELEGEQENEFIDSFLNLHHEELSAEKALTQAETEKLEAKENELKEANKTIKNLEKNRMDPEEVKQQIDDYKTTIEGLQQDLVNQKIDSYVSTQLTLAGAHDVEVCQSNLKFDRAKIKSKEDYQIIDDAIKQQIKEKAFLYKNKEDSNKENSNEKKTPANYVPRVGNGRKEINDSTGKDFAKKLSAENQGFLVKGVID